MAELAALLDAAGIRSSVYGAGSGANHMSEVWP